MTLVDVDEDDDDDACTLIVSLMQVGRRKLRKKLGANSNLTIGFAIYKVCLVEFVMGCRTIMLYGQTVIYEVLKHAHGSALVVAKTGL